MLGLEVNAGASGLICQQREEGVKDTGCFNTKSHQALANKLQTLQLLFTRVFLATCPLPTGPRPPQCGREVPPLSRG